MNKKIILFDFDKTISDTYGFLKQFCFEVNKSFLIPEEEIIKILDEYRLGLDSSTDFRPEEYAKEISTKTGIKQELIEKIVFDPKNHQPFEDTFEVLDKLSKNNDLGIFSEGFDNWQKKKIQLTGIWDFFDQKLMIIERRKLLPESISKIPNKAVVVDDKKEVIEILANTRPDLKLVWINRNNEEKLETSQIRTIKVLSDLLTI